MSGDEFAAYRPAVARTFTLPRQALNDAENLMIRIAQNPDVLATLGWDPYGQRKIEAARQAISDAIEASDREYR